METLEMVIDGMIIAVAFSSIYAVRYQMRKVQGDMNRVCDSMTSVNDALWLMLFQEQKLLEIKLF